MQDFYATIYLANIAAFAAEEAGERILIADEGRNLNYHRQANRNRTIAKLRDLFLRLIMEPDPVLRDAILEKLIVSVAKYPLPVVPRRSPLRKIPRSKRFYIARKPVV